jgi:hypothetical protein
MQLKEVEIEHIYIMCENIPIEKNYIYSKIYRNVNKYYGKEGLYILEQEYYKNLLIEIKTNGYNNLLQSKIDNAKKNILKLRSKLKKV